MNLKKQFLMISVPQFVKLQVFKILGETLKESYSLCVDSTLSQIPFHLNLPILLQGTMSMVNSTLPLSVQTAALMLPFPMFPCNIAL